MRDSKNYQGQDLCYLSKPKVKVGRRSTALCNSQLTYSVPCSFLFVIPELSLGFENWSCLSPLFAFTVPFRLRGSMAV